MSESANTKPVIKTAPSRRPAARGRWMGTPGVLAAATLALFAVTATLLFGSAFGSTVRMATLVCTGASAALACAVAFGLRRDDQLDSSATRDFADELCAAHDKLAARCEMLAAELAAAHATQSALLAGAPHLAILLTDPHGRITACNPGATRLACATVRELAGRASILDFLLTSELVERRIGSSDSSVPSAWTATAFRSPPASQTWTWRQRDGSHLPVALAAIAQRNAENEISGYLVVAEDLTAQVLAQKRLQAIQVASRALVDAPALADALPKILQAVGTTLTWETARLWSVDTAGRVLSATHQWQAPAQSSSTPPLPNAAEMAGQAAADGDARWQALPSPADGTLPRAVFFVPLRLGRTARGVIEITACWQAGDAADACAMLATLAACVGQFLEKKEAQKRMFEAETAVSTAARAKSDFLALMSHEIRTPMNGVIGMSNLLLDTALTPKQRDFAQTIRSSGDALLTVINDILDFSKMEAGKLHFERIDFDLRSAIEDTLELMAGNAHAKQLELAAHVHPDVPHLVHGDPNRLRQVLNNLVANAIKFTAQGEVIITVAREATSSDQRTVLRFAIRDTGIGIPSEVQKRLFQPFMQADTSTTRRFGGTGLGLAISRTLVEMMHGRIGVVSEEGKGSTFHFTIRFDRAKEHSPAPSPAALSPAGARVLVVEDNAAHAHILGQHLKAWGLRPTRAATREAALNHIRAALATQEPFALALIDATLPDAGETQLPQQLVAEFKLAAPKMILIAGVGQQFEDPALRTAGVAACVTKPVRESRLHEAVRTVLNGGTRSAPQALRAPAHVVGAAAPAASTGPRILLVEDNVINQQLALQLLERMGLAADVAIDGVEALAALRRKPYELVLMDCMMPKMDGYETTRRIREIERRRAALGIARPEVYIIALTANTTAEDRARCVAAGMNAFVPKPLRAAELQRHLERWQQGSRMISGNQGTGTESNCVTPASVG